MISDKIYRAMKNLLFLLLISICPFAVVGQSVVRVPIGQNIDEKKEVKLSEVAREMTFVPLETKEGCMMDADISKVEVFENVIFVSDFTFIYRFDMDGKFINRIGKIGNGPGEYVKGIQTFLIDKQKRRLMFFDSISKRIMQYDFEGNFITGKNVSFLPGMCEWVSDDSFAVYNMGFSYEREPWRDLYVMTDDAKALQKNKFKKQADKRYGLMIYPPIFFRYNGMVRYKNPHENIIYNISRDDKPNPVYYLDYGKYERYSDVDDAIIKVKNGVGTNLRNPKSTEKIGLIGMSETDDFLFMDYGHREGRRFAAYNKKDKSFYQIFDNDFELYGFKDDLHNGLPLLPKHNIANNVFIMSYHAWKVKEYLQGKSNLSPRLKKIVDAIDESDNPILIFVELK
ncbi:6-bladed beta-propeller [Puteibacter caeruleilacunae]|nr:6-bladed beta-propeller [Puteibacter caeruleilacunae]